MILKVASAAGSRLVIATLAAAWAWMVPSAVAQVVVSAVDRSVFVRAISSIPGDMNHGGQSGDSNHTTGPWVGGGTFGPGVGNGTDFGNAAAIVSQQTDVTATRLQGVLGASIEISSAGAGSTEASTQSGFGVTFAVLESTVATVQVGFNGTAGARLATLSGAGGSVLSTADSFTGPINLAPGVYTFRIDISAVGVCTGGCAQAANRQANFDVSFSSQGQGQGAFVDTFSPASSLWSNTRGNWTSVNGRYLAQNPSNNPTTYTDLPFDMSDFEISVRVVNLTDGGVWLRTDGTNRNGILLVTGGNGYGQGLRSPQAGSRLYFHRVVNGGFSGSLQETGNIFTPGTDHTLRIVVRGNKYRVFVDGSATAATTLTDGTYTHGRVGLYSDQPNVAAGGSGQPQAFSDFSLRPIGPAIVEQPTSSAECGQTSGEFSVVAEGAEPFAYQWQIEATPGNWVSLGNDPGPLEGGGFAYASPRDSATVTIGVIGRMGEFNVRCVATNPLGSVESEAAALVVQSCCSADFNHDGIVDPDDLADYIGAFFSVPPAAGSDFNNDGLTDPDDLADFIGAFFTPC